MFYIIDNGASYPDHRETLIVSAPDTFEHWFRTTLRPLVAELPSAHPLHCKFDPRIVAECPTLKPVEGQVYSPDELVALLYPANHPRKPRFDDESPRTPAEDEPEGGEKYQEMESFNGQTWLLCGGPTSRDWAVKNAARKHVDCPSMHHRVVRVEPSGRHGAVALHLVPYQQIYEPPTTEDPET